MESYLVGLLIESKTASFVLYLRILATDLCPWNAEEQYVERRCAVEHARVIGAGRHTHARRQPGRSHARQTELRLNIAHDFEETTKGYICFNFRAECCCGGATKSNNTQGITLMALFAMHERQKGYEGAGFLVTLG